MSNRGSLLARLAPPARLTGPSHCTMREMGVQGHGAREHGGWKGESVWDSLYECPPGVQLRVTHKSLPSAEEPLVHHGHPISP